ncbi:MAG: hypothetical protein QME74_07450 [Candidatus Edwardsbacteria bacterium]|nr:hypothetical protein [Candidatus Edwardsbacteria bacterium]
MPVPDGSAGASFRWVLRPADRGFHKPHDAFFYLLQDLAFVPVPALLVTLILNDPMVRREKKPPRRKMNSETGGELIAHLVRYNRGFAELQAAVKLDGSWESEDFRRARGKIAGIKHDIDARQADLESLKTFPLGKRAFVLSLLENQNLLERQRFTNLKKPLIGYSNRILSPAFTPCFSNQPWLVSMA